MLLVVVLVWLVWLHVCAGEKHYKPVLQPVAGGNIVMIKTMIMEEDCGKMDTLYFCSRRPMSELEGVSVAICKSVVDTTYVTGVPISYQAVEGIIPAGYDFECTGKENSLDQCRATHVHCEQYVVVECRKPGLQGLCNSNCGCMAPALLSKIIGGDDANLGEFPWQVTVTSGKYMCGGSIVDSRHIVTAAHCLHSPSRHSVPCKAQPGQHGLQQCRWFTGGYKIYYDTVDFHKRENAQQKITWAQAVFVHPDYVRDKYRLVHDIALIRLKEPLEMSAYVQPICLPDHWGNQGEFSIPGEAKLTVSGFGDTSRKRQGVYPSTLQKATLEWEEIGACNKTMYHLMRREHICAGDKQGVIDACQGDSGGPLMYKNEEGVATLVGVVSFSYGCAIKGLWSVYTDVQKELGFVRSVLNGRIDSNTVVKSCARTSCTLQE